MKKVLVVTLILVLALSARTFAFQNEPEGFRGLKWGDPVREGMILLGKTEGEAKAVVLAAYAEEDAAPFLSNADYQRAKALTDAGINEMISGIILSQGGISGKPITFSEGMTAALMTALTQKKQMTKEEIMAALQELLPKPESQEPEGDENIDPEMTPEDTT